MRRFVLILASAAALFLAAVLSLPWWLGFAVARVGPTFGLTHGGYERLGYGRFVVRDVEVRRPGVRVTVERIEGDTPLLWLWRRATGGTVRAAAGDWRAEVERRQRPAGATKPRGWVPLRQQLFKVAERLDRWIPEASVGAGVVTWPGGGLTIASAEWKERVLTSPEVGYRALKAAAVVRFSSDGVIEAEARDPEHDLSVVLRSRGEEIQGELSWLGERAGVAACFLPQGWRPSVASLTADAWEIPGAKLRLGNLYREIRGGGRVEWRDQTLLANFSAEGLPVEGTRAPPLKVDVRGHGADGVFVAEALEVELPGIRAQLSDPVSIDRRGMVRSAASRFVLETDLSQQPWFAAAGSLRGSGTIEANAEGRPLVRFSVAGQALTFGAIELTQLDARGALDWPRLELEQVAISAPGGDELGAQGGWNFRTREFAPTTLRARLHRSLVARWLPENPAFDVIEIDARANGAWPAPTHRGSARLEGFRLKGGNPAVVGATWDGRGDVVDEFAAEARIGGTLLKARGSGDRAGLKLNALDLTKGETPLLHLAEPAEIRWADTFQAGPVRLRGDGARVDATLAWGDVGRIDLAVQGWKSNWLRDLVALPKPEWSIDALTLWGKWERGPATYAADVELTVEMPDRRAAHLSAQINGTPDELQLKLLRASEGEGVVVNASGALPLTIQPGGTPWLAFNEEGPFTLDAATSPNPEFWEKFTELTGLELVHPEAAVHFGGTWQHPQGEARLRADRLEAVSGRFKDVWPKIESLDAHITGDRDGVKLEQFSLAVNGQAVRVEGWLPVTAARWREFVRDPRAVARRGDLRVQVPDADLAAVAQHFPNVLAPKGKMQLDVTLKPDATVHGFLRIKEATSRPLGPLGVLQEVNADLRFEGRRVDLANVTARMAGQTITLRGSAELPEEGNARLNLALEGENLPFVRRTGLLLRGDLDLQLVTAESGRTTISGRVGLRDSLFLSDLRALVPTGAKGSATRPPYFSIEVEPLGGWRLDIAVEGDRFMQLRTPVFTGTASAKLRLGGTLREPLASGEVIIDEGNVRLPFANFEVRQGYVRIAAGQPEPQIFVTGTTRRYGYDLRMELSGAAAAPNLTFSSSPALEAEQVLLMVMAGQAPNDEITTTGRQRAARFGAFFGQSLLGTLGGDSAGADRLTISSGEDISEQGRETYNIEYRLDKRWSVTGEYDEFDEYYGGLKWRIYSKGGKRDENR